MTDIEVALANLGELAPRELAKKHKPYELKENKEIAKKRGKTAKVARDDLEKKLGETIISKQNVLPYQYKDDENSNKPT